MALSTVYPTLIDVSRVQDPDGSIADVADIIAVDNDIMDDIPWIEGNLDTGHQMSVYTSKPTPSFRQLNAGVVPQKVAAGQYVEGTGIMEARSRIDKDLPRANDPKFRLVEDRGIISSMGELFATKLIYGDISVYKEEFNGLASRYFSLSTAYTTYGQVLSAGGSGSDNSSIWLVGWSPDTVFGIYPKGSKAGLSQEDLGLHDVITNATTGATMRCYESWFQWKCGLAVKDYRYVVRIPNIDISALLTAGDSSDTSANIEKLMMRALGLLPTMKTNMRLCFYMNSTVQSMLAYKIYDKGNMFFKMEEVQRGSILRPGKVLTFQGVPCRRVNAILNTESAVTT